MSRSERLFDLLHALRRRRRPVSGKVLAEEIGVSIRTLYRDIASLQAQGANIEGEPGVGYVLKPGFLLPPLMFPPEEIEALALGCRWVADRADHRLRDAALSALARIAAVLPADLGDELDASALLVGPGAAAPVDVVDPALLRKAIRAERKLRLSYRDSAGQRRGGWSGRSRWLSSTRRACCSAGASCARIFATSALTGFPRLRCWTFAIRSAAGRCLRNGGRRRRSPAAANDAAGIWVVSLF